jgi:hypothetical protein
MHRTGRTHEDEEKDSCCCYQGVIESSRGGVTLRPGEESVEKDH